LFLFVIVFVVIILVCHSAAQRRNLLLPLPLLFSCHPSAKREDLLLLSIFTVRPDQETVTSTEATHAFCERRSGEIRFSTSLSPSRHRALVFAFFFVVPSGKNPYLSLLLP
jgi:hypothetical protein